MPIKIATVQTGLERSIQRAAKNVNARGGLNIAINDRQFTGPLGKITGSVSEFNKSLEASNARVIAFGASVGIIQGVQKALAGMVTSAIEVEKRLTEINVVMGLTSQQLNKFGDDLFKVAKNTAQSFSTVATAATELARQGLTMEETLKRTNDALILTRLTGLDAESAVSGLTAALNTFNAAGLDSTKILSKMAAVDVQFAVSTEDLIDAVSRAGAVANDAGVSFDQLLGAVTAAQQMTARGGKVIGNSFKTIFTRVQRSSTIQRLEELGIAVRDVAGNTLPAITVLQNLAQTYDTLADTTKAAVAEQVGGVFQINILKAAIKDLSDENSILARATEISSQATDEAYKKNEILNRSLAALTSQTATSIKELASIMGELTFADGVTDALNVIKSSVEQFSNFLGKEQGESAGADFAQGLLKGIGKALTGPGLLIASALLLKLFGKTLSFLKGSAGELLGVVSASQKQKQIQESIVAVLSENSSLQKRILSQEGNRAAQEKTILSILQAQTREQQKISAAARVIAPGVAKAGYNASLTKTRSEGHVPNYVKPEERLAETRGAIEGGYRPGSIKSMKMPGLGRVIYNSAEEVKKFPGMRESAIIPPSNSKAGKKYKRKFEKAHGFDPYKNKGHVPEFSRQEGLAKYISQSSYIKFQKNNEKSVEKKILSGGGLENAKNLKFGELPSSKFAKASELYYNKTPQNQRVDPEDLPNTFVDSDIKNALNLKESFVPNFNPLRINSRAIQTISSTAKIREDGFDGRIGMSKLLEILSGRLFTSIKYRAKKSEEGFQTLFLSGARSGVHKYKKGAPPPKGYNSWKELDEATGTKVVHANSVGVGEKGFRRLKLKRVESVVSRGKHYEVDPNMAASGHIPNYEFDKNKFGPYVVGKEVLNIGKEGLRGTANFGLKGLESIYNIGKSTLGGINNMMLSNPRGAGLMGLGTTAAFSTLPGPAAAVVTAAMAAMHGLASAAEYGPSNPDPEGQRKAEEARIKNLRGLNRFGPYAALRSLTDIGVSGARKTGSSIIGAGKSLFQSGVGAIKSINTSMVRDPRGFLGGMAPIGAIGGAFATLPPVLATFLSAGIAGTSALAGAGKQYGQIQERSKAARAATLNAQTTEQMIAKGEKGVINPALLGKSIGKVRAGQLPKQFQEKAISMMRKGGNRGSYITRAMRKVLGIKSDGFVPNLAKPGMTLTPKAPSTLWATHPTFNIDSIRKHGIKTFPGTLSKYQSRSEEIRRLEKMDEHGMLGLREKTQLDFMKQQEGRIFGWGTKPQAHVMGFQRAFKDKFERNLKIPMEELSSLYNVVKFRVDPKKWIRDDLDPTYNNAWRSRQDVSPEDIISIKPIDQVLAKETLKTNPTAAGAILSSGFVPNYARRVPSVIKSEEIKGYDGAPSQVRFSSNVEGKPFTESMAVIIPDPKNSLKPGLQVVNTLESNPDLRGRGYGRELYEYMADYAKKKGYAGLYGDMGTSPSVMRVVDSIAKKGKFNVEKNSDLKFFKDDFDTTGMYASDSWTYKLSNEGLIPNYSISRTMARLQDSATYARGKLTPVQSRSQGKLKDFILRRAKLNTEAREFEPPKFDLTLARNGKPIEYLDNSTASRARAAVVTSDGKTHLGYWHDNIRDDLKRRKVNLRGSKDLELTWASQGLIPNYKNFKQPKIYNDDGLIPNDPESKRAFPKGKIPNYALMGAPIGTNYLSGLRDINPQIYSDSIIDRAESLKDEQKRNAALLEISKRPSEAVKSLQYLDNSGLEKIKTALIADRALGSSDWTYVKSGVGKVTSADVSRDLSRIPAKEIFNYLTGKTDRIQGSVPGHFIRLLDHSDRTMQARDIVGSSQRVTKVIKQQIAAIRKSPKRRHSVMDEVLNKDVLKLGYDPLRGQSMAQRRSNELRQKFGMGGVLAQMHKPSSSFSGSSAGFGKFGDQTLNNILSDPKSKHIHDLIHRTNVTQQKINLKPLAGQVRAMQENKSMSEKYGPNWKMWDEYQNKRQTMSARDARAAVTGVRVPDSMQKSFDTKVSRINRMFRGRGFNLDLSKGYVPNYALGKIRTIAQAVGMFKKDTGSFSALSGKNFWSRRANAIKLRESNYEDVRQFINSRSFRLLDPKEQKRVIKDLKNQSEEINMNDVTRPYFKYDDADFQGRILSSKGLIPNYNLANRKVFYLKDVEVIRNPNVKDLRSLRKDFEKEYPLSSWSGGDPKTRFTIDTDGNRYIWPSHAGMHSYVEPLLQRNIKKDVSQTFSSSHNYNTGFVPNYTKFISGQAQSILQKSPQYSGAVLDAVKREASFGVTPKVVAAPSLRSSSNPGLAVVNHEQEGGSLAKARMLHGGLNPKQKSSVPNYALTGGDITNIQYGSDVGKSQLGLTAMEQSFYKAKDAIDLMSVSAGKSRKALDKVATNYARSSQVATESNLRYAAQMGKLEKETPERQNFARQMYRREALGDMASSGGRDALLAQDLGNSKDFEKAILDRKEIAKRSGNTELEKSLSRINRNLDKSAAQLMNQPKTIARSLERNLTRESLDMKRLSKFTGDEGFSKQKAQQFFARQFLQQRGINVQDKQQANSIIAAMGKQGAKELGKFMDSQGVKSSNPQLAKAGFGSGELRSLTNKQSGTFVQGFKTLEQKLTSTSVKDRVIGSRLAIGDLRKEAMRIGKDNAAVTSLNKKIDDFKKAVQTSSRTADQTSRQNAAQQRIVNAGTGTRGALERFKGSFQMGAAGSRNFAGGSRVGGFLGRAGGFVGSKAKDFASRGVGGFGGQVGLGLSFIAPMLAGIVQNPKSRIDRASFKDGSLQVEGTQNIGDRDVMSSVLMGTGMGAIFGPGGALVGAAAGFVTAMRKTTLSLEEQVQLREKEISLIGQNLQAVGSVQNLSNARVQAFQSGNQEEVNRIDAAINSTLASINDEEILRKVSNAAGDTNALSNVEKILQDRMTVATSGQNFAMAMKNDNVKNAGVAMGSIIAQNIRNGLVDSDVAKDALKNITSNVAQRRKSGQLLSVEEMSSLRATASGKGNAFFGDNTLWKKVGTGVGLAAGVALAAILAPFTGGGSLAVGATLLTSAAGGAALGYAGGAMEDQEVAQDRLDEMKELGVNELKELEKLVDAGAMTERTLNFLVAAFNEGKMGIDEIAKEALKSVEQFEKIEKNSARTATQLFDLDNKFKIAIRKLMTSMEIDKIETTSKIDRQKSTAGFVSQFMDQKTGTNFMARQQSDILAQEIALSLRQFTQESSALLMKDIRTKGKTLNLMPSQTEGLIDLIEKRGSQGVQSMVNERKVGAQYQLKLTPENVGLILKESGLSADGKGLANIKDTSRLAPILQTEDKNQQLNIISNLQKNLQQVKDTGVLDVTFEKKLTDQNAKILQELLDERNTQKEILQANIEAQRKSLQLQLAQNKIQTEISSNLVSIQMRSANRAQQRDIDMINQQSKSERKITSLDFESSEIFRGMNTDEEENERQSKIRKKIFDEEFKLRKQEDLNSFKIEASRLLSEKTLVDALNNLSSTIREELKQQGLVSDVDDAASGTPSKPVAGRKKGSAAAEWLKNFEKTGKDMVVKSTADAPGTPSQPVTKGERGSAAAEWLKNFEKTGKDTVVKSTADVPGTPSQPVTKGERGSAAAQWLKNFQKTRTDMVVGSTSDSPDLKFIPQNKKNSEIQERIKERSLVIDDLSGQKNVATKNIAEAENAKDITRKRLFSLKDAALKMEEGDRKGAEAILSDMGRADMFKPPDNPQYQPYEGMYGSPTYSDKIFDKDLKQKISSEISTKQAIFEERNRVLKDYLNQRQNLERQIEEETEAIRSLETEKTETSTLPEKVKQQSIALEKFDLIKTEIAMIQVDDANSLNEAGSKLTSILEQARQNNSSDDVIATIESMSLLVKKMQAGQKAFSESFKIQEAQRKVDEFLGGLDFGSAATEPLQRLRVIENMDGSEVRSQAASNALQNAVMQAQREKAYEVVMQDPSATNLEKAESRLAKNAASFGSKDQRQQMSQFVEEKSAKSLALKNAEFQGNDQAVLDLRASISQLDNSMEQLALQMERSTRRDSQPAYKAFASDFSDGLDAGFADIQARSEGIYSRLGRDLPNAFHTGMVDAMQAAIMGADDMGDVLNNIGYNFLSIIQRAFLESAASRMMGIFGFNNGGYVTGGSGVKDDVPALLTGGEYVMRRSAVEKYGTGFMNSLNQGTIPGFNQGGMVGLDIKGPKAAVREEYEDKNDYGSVTRYKVLREKRGIDSRMSSYAVTNDRKIQKFMRDEENQFNEDLGTKRQEAYRKAYTKAAKEREAKIEQQKKDNKKKMMRNMLIGIAGAALLSYGMSKAGDWYKGTKFGQGRFKNKAQKQLDDKGFVTVKGSNGFKDMTPADEYQTKAFFNRMHKAEGPIVTSNQLNMRGIPAKVGTNRISWSDSGNYEGGMVRAALSGGEYVVNPQAVQAIGTSTLSRINNGSLNSAGPGGGTQVTHGDVNININVASDGTTSSSSGKMGDQEFATKVKGAVLNVIKNERRQGGSLR